MALPALRSGIQCGGRRPRAITFYSLEAFLRHRRFGSGGGSILSQATDKIPTYVVGLDDRLNGGFPHGPKVSGAGTSVSLKTSFSFRLPLSAELEQEGSRLYLSIWRGGTS